MPMYCIINGMKVLGTAISDKCPKCNNPYDKLSYLGPTSCRTYGWDNHRTNHTDITNVWLGTHLLYFNGEKVMMDTLMSKHSPIDITVISNTIEFLKKKDSLSQIDTTNLLRLIELQREYTEAQMKDCKTIEEASKDAELMGYSIRSLILQYTKIDTHDLYR